MRFTTALLSALIAASVPAAPVSPEAAKRAAQGWLERGLSLADLRGRSAAEVVTLSAGGRSVNVVTLAGGGFVVLGTDDRQPPVIAFSGAGGKLPESASDPLRALLARNPDLDTPAAGGGRVVLGAAADSPRTATQRRWDALLSDGVARLGAGSRETLADVRVPPLVRTKWGQESNSMYSDTGEPCYNYYTPSNYSCGCVATAMAQLMRYHCYPAVSKVSAFSCSVDGKAVKLSNFGGPYAYDDMPFSPEAHPYAPTYAGGATEAQRRAIGMLTYDCAVSMRMNWGHDSKGSWGSSYGGFEHEPLMKVFGFASAKSYLAGGNDVIPVAGVLQMVIPNLDAGCPVALGVDGHKVIVDGHEVIEEGHEVIADGYGYSDSTLYVHLNMGWSGLDDVWYALPTVDKPTSGIRLSGVSSVVYNVFPTKTGDLLSGRVTDAEGTPVAGVRVHALNSTGTKTIDTVRTDGRGIYAFWLPGGATYSVRAGAGEARKVKLLASVSPASVNFGTGVFTLGSGTKAMSYGNSWSNDLVYVEETASAGGVSVPYSWLEARYPERCADADADAYAALAAETGLNGCAVWASYLAGLEPTNAESRLLVTIRMEGGRPIVEWNVTNAAAEALGYVYRLKGRRELTDEWAPTNATHRFFRVFLERK